MEKQISLDEAQRDAMREWVEKSWNPQAVRLLWEMGPPKADVFVSAEEWRLKLSRLLAFVHASAEQYASEYVQVNPSTIKRMLVVGNIPALPLMCKIAWTHKMRIDDLIIKEKYRVADDEVTWSEKVADADMIRSRVRRIATALMSNSSLELKFVATRYLHLSNGQLYRWSKVGAVPGWKHAFGLSYLCDQSMHALFCSYDLSQGFAFEEYSREKEEDDYLLRRCREAAENIVAFETITTGAAPRSKIASITRRLYKTARGLKKTARSDEVGDRRVFKYIQSQEHEAECGVFLHFNNGFGERIVHEYHMERTEDSSNDLDPVKLLEGIIRKWESIHGDRIWYDKPASSSAKK